MPWTRRVRTRTTRARSTPKAGARERGWTTHATAWPPASASRARRSRSRAAGPNRTIAAILGAVRASGRKGHVLASAIDHHAVLHALDALAAEGHEVELLPVDDRGAVDPAAFAAALRPATILASVFYANNEIGTVSPVAELARIARERGVLFHTDAVQAPGWLPLDVGIAGSRPAVDLGAQIRRPEGSRARSTFAAACCWSRSCTAAAKSSAGAPERKT